MASQRHIRAVNRSISALNLDRSDVHAAWVEFARALARILDGADPEKLVKFAPLYRSVLRELRRAGVDRAASTPSEPSEPAENVSPPNKLQQLRDEKRLRGVQR